MATSSVLRRLLVTGAFISSWTGGLAARHYLQAQGLANEKAIADELTKVNTYKGSAWAIWETDGVSVTLLQEKLDGKFGSFKAVLRECAPRGKACFGILKLQYPIVIGSNTPKNRALIFFVNEGERIKEKLGSSKGTRVVMATASQAFPEFRKIQEAAVALPVLEEQEDIEGVKSTDIWDKFSSKGADEHASFEAYMASASESGEEGTAAMEDADHGPQHDGAATGGPVIDASLQSSSTPKASRTQASGGQVQTNTDYIDKAIGKMKVELVKEFEKSARKIAQDEVGRAIRKMGTDVGGKMSDIGSEWIKKASS